MKGLISFAAALALAAVAPAQAASDTDAIRAANNHVALQAGVGVLGYHEDATAQQTAGGSLDSEHGALPTLSYDISRQGTLFGIQDLYSSVGVTMSFGPTRYDGYALDANSENGLGAPLSFSHSTMMADIDVKLGKAFRVYPKLQLTPYAEYVLHDWKRSAGETYLHHELGLGLLTQYAVTPRAVVSLDVAIAKTLGAKTMTYEGLPAEKLASRMTQSVKLAGDYALTQKLHLLATYEFRHFSYGRSDFAPGYYGSIYSDSWYEPSSRTNQNLFLVGMSYPY